MKYYNIPASVGVSKDKVFEIIREHIPENLMVSKSAFRDKVSVVQSWLVAVDVIIDKKRNRISVTGTQGSVLLFAVLLVFSGFIGYIIVDLIFFSSKREKLEVTVAELLMKELAAEEI